MLELASDIHGWSISNHKIKTCENNTVYIVKSVSDCCKSPSLKEERRWDFLFTWLGSLHVVSVRLQIYQLSPTKISYFGPPCLNITGWAPLLILHGAPHSSHLLALLLHLVGGGLQPAVLLGQLQLQLLVVPAELAQLRLHLGGRGRVKGQISGLPIHIHMCIYTGLTPRFSHKRVSLN